MALESLSQADTQNKCAGAIRSEVGHLFRQRNGDRAILKRPLVG